MPMLGPTSTVLGGLPGGAFHKRSLQKTDPPDAAINVKLRILEI